MPQEPTKRRALTANQHRAIDLELIGKNQTRIGKILGVDRTTVHHWRKHPEYQAELARRRGETREILASRVAHIAAKALTTLNQIIKDPNARDSSRVAAATKILELALAGAGFHDEDGHEEAPKALEIRIVSDRGRPPTPPAPEPNPDEQPGGEEDC